MQRILGLAKLDFIHLYATIFSYAPLSFVSSLVVLDSLFPDELQSVSQAMFGCTQFYIMDQ